MNIRTCNDLLRRDKEVIAPGQHLLYYPLAVRKTDGDIITDEDGNEYIDFLSSASSLNLGGCQPDILRVSMKQLLECPQYTAAYSINRPMVEYAERLTSVYPGGISVKVCFSNCGSESMDIAMKFARTYTGRSLIASFTGSYHGSTCGASELSDLQDRSGILGIGHCLLECRYEDEDSPAVSECLQDVIPESIDPDCLAAVVIEPVQGDGGMRVVNHDFMRRLHRMCKEHGILFIVDEVQQGLFRTGYWFSIEDYGIIPDGIVLGKSLGAGFPLGAFIARSGIMDCMKAPSPVFSLAGYHIACAAGCRGFDIMATSDFRKKVQRNALMLSKGLEEIMATKVEGIKTYLTGMGLSYGLHFINEETGLPAEDFATEIMYRCYEKGLVTIVLREATLRIQPPLNMRRKNLEEGLLRLREAIEDVQSGNRASLEVRCGMGWK